MPNAQIVMGQPLVYVSFSAEIAPSTTETLLSVMADLANLNVQEVCLAISTQGGSVMHGLNLYNMLRAMPFKLTTHNVGNVDSIGNAVFLAGEKRFAAPHSTFMFHGVGFPVDGSTRMEERTCRERLNGILADQNRIGSIIAERTKVADTEKLFAEAQTKDATYALGVGIVDEIRDIKIANGDPVIALVFQRQSVK